MLALILLTDGYHERRCNTLFTTEPRVTEATVNRIKKTAGATSSGRWTVTAEERGDQLARRRCATEAETLSANLATVVYARPTFLLG